MCDIVLPFATNCADLKNQGNSKAVWNETIFIDEEASNIFDPENVILFEVLDFVPQLLKQKDKI